MAISFACSQCGKDYVVSDGLAGKSAICKACGARMTVPGDAANAEASEAVPIAEETAPPEATGPAAVAPAPRKFAAGPTFAPAKPAGSRGAGRVVWLIVIVGAAVFGGLRGAGLTSKSDVRAFHQRLYDLHTQLVATLKGVKDVPTAKAASGPAKQTLQQLIDLLDKEGRKKGRKADIKAITDEFQPKMEAVNQEFLHEYLRISLIPEAIEALDISDLMERFGKVGEELSKADKK